MQISIELLLIFRKFYKNILDKRPVICFSGRETCNREVRVMKRNSFFGLLILVVFAFLVSSCGGSGSPGSPGTSGGGEAGSMLTVEAVAPSTTLLDASDQLESESVDVTIGNYDLPNRTGTASAITFTRYTVEYKTVPLKNGGPFLDNRTYSGTWYVDANTNATFSLPFWDDYTKLQYRFPKDPHLYHYTVIFTMTGYNVFGKKVTVVFQFNVTTEL